MTRRSLLGALGAPAIVRAERPVAPVMSGDVVPGSALVWTRADRASRMAVTWRTSARGEARRVQGPWCTEATDYTGRVVLTDLPAGQTILYEVEFDGAGEPSRGSFRTPGASRGVRFLWSGDCVGQGYGINPEWGGMRIFETMRRAQPDFFLHSGDTIYADNPVPAEVKAADGTVWKNLTHPDKAKAAETLDEFRGAYRYNLLDENVRRFNAEVAQVWQWDDHEVMNNWSPAMAGIGPKAARAARAFLEYAPMRYSPVNADRVYRKIAYGPLVDVFVLDMRSDRGPNTGNRQAAMSGETAFLGAEQVAWLKRELVASRAVWKVIAADMPIGLIVKDGPERFEAVANGDGPALGRELEIADLLGFCKRQRVRNMVWFTADVHYTAAHFYDPRKAKFTGFDPFWEFVSGPLNAGTFGPGVVDDTFGIQVVYQKHPPKGSANLPPSAGMQFFGEVAVDAREMRVKLRDVAGVGLFVKTLVAG